MVILVHGLWMHGVAMAWMRSRLARAGYAVHCFSYRTVRASLSENARQLAAYCAAQQATPLHFVGHSLGGLVIATMLEQVHTLNVGRIVFLGTPFVDSHAAHRLGRSALGRRMLGASIAEWLRGARPRQFTRYDVGAIAGNGSVGLGVMMARDLPRPHDGAVCVAETHVPNMRDHIVLPVSHSQMVISPAVVKQTCAFLRDGRFARAGGES